VLKRATRRTAVFLFCLAARNRALCAFEELTLRALSFD
jgi:hypothetical protein